jgi:hypothetical protein
MSVLMVATFGPSAGVFSDVSLLKSLWFEPDDAATRYLYVDDGLRPESSNVVADGVPTVAKVPAVPSARWTMYEVAPDTALYVTCALVAEIAVTVTPVGTDRPGDDGSSSSHPPVTSASPTIRPSGSVLWNGRFIVFT